MPESIPAAPDTLWTTEYYGLAIAALLRGDRHVEEVLARPGVPVQEPLGDAPSVAAVPQVGAGLTTPAMAQAISVSSDHWPGAMSPRPPPSIRGSPAAQSAAVIRGVARLRAGQPGSEADAVIGPLWLADDLRPDHRRPRPDGRCADHPRPADPGRDRGLHARRRDDIGAGLP